MALVPNRPAATVRRIAMYSLATDVVVSLIVFVIISHLLALILFLLGLAASALVYYNFMQVLKTRGIRGR